MPLGRNVPFAMLYPMPALAIGHRRDRTASDDGSDDPPRAVIRELRIRYECSRKGFVLRSLGEIGSVRYTEHMKLARRLLTDTTQEKTYMTFDEIANSTAVLGELQQFYTVGETRERLRQQLPICWKRRPDFEPVAAPNN